MSPATRTLLIEVRRALVTITKALERYLEETSNHAKQ